MSEAITVFAEKICEFLRTSELSESGTFIRRSVKEIVVKHGDGDDPLHGPDASGQPDRRWRCRRSRVARGSSQYSPVWLGTEDSNPDLLIQSQLSYH